MTVTPDFVLPFDRIEEEGMYGDEPQFCPDCNGLVSDDGMTIDPDKCCFTCKAD